MVHIPHDRQVDVLPAGIRHANPGKVLPGDIPGGEKRRERRELAGETHRSSLIQEPNNPLHLMPAAIPQRPRARSWPALVQFGDTKSALLGKNPLNGAKELLVGCDVKGKVRGDAATRRCREPAIAIDIATQKVPIADRRDCGWPSQGKGLVGHDPVQTEIATHLIRADREAGERQACRRNVVPNRMTASQSPREPDEMIPVSAGETDPHLVSTLDRTIGRNKAKPIRDFLTTRRSEERMIARIAALGIGLGAAGYPTPFQQTTYCLARDSKLPGKGIARCPAKISGNNFIDLRTGKLSHVLILTQPATSFNREVMCAINYSGELSYTVSFLPDCKDRPCGRLRFLPRLKAGVSTGEI